MQSSLKSFGKPNAAAEKLDKLVNFHFHELLLHTNQVYKVSKRPFSASPPSMHRVQNASGSYVNRDVVQYQLRAL